MGASPFAEGVKAAASRPPERIEWNFFFFFEKGFPSTDNWDLGSSWTQTWGPALFLLELGKFLLNLQLPPCEMGITSTPVGYHASKESSN